MVHTWTLISAKGFAPMPGKAAETRETLMRRAKHARRLADTVLDEPAAERLRSYADELDAQAAAMDGGNEGE